MKMKTYKQELIDYHKRSEQLYCCYCLEPKYENVGCCQENHFLTFVDLDDDAKEAIIEVELKEHEDWIKTNE
jgi:hypothetical protein